MAENKGYDPLVDHRPTEELSDEEVFEWGKATGYLIEVLPGKWATRADARRWFCGGTVVSDDDAKNLANQLRRMAESLDDSTGEP